MKQLQQKYSDDISVVRGEGVNAKLETIKIGEIE